MNTICYIIPILPTKLIIAYIGIMRAINVVFKNFYDALCAENVQTIRTYQDQIDVTMMFTHIRSCVVL